MTEATILGKILEFERGARLLVGEISYEPRVGEALSGIRLELTFQETAGGCLVTVRQDVPDEGPAYDRYRSEAGEGWETSLADLKRWIEGPRERRFEIEAGLPEM
jgi:uncharacterized protein YndB with AHSA1/START domain